MRRLLILLVLTGILIGTGCSAINSTTTPADRAAQIVRDGRSPVLAFQLNAGFAMGLPGLIAPWNIPLCELGLTKEEILEVIIGGSLVNACMPIDVDVPEWDEWLLATTMDVDVPEWDEWMNDVDVPEWDEWLLEVDVPEWDEWLLRFENMPKYRPTDWMAWAVYGPMPIIDIDVPEWDEWLLDLMPIQMGLSYNAWMIRYNCLLNM